MAVRGVASGAITGEGLRPSGAPTDRRLIRGDRTRRVIVESMIDLIEAGNPQPTSRQVAENACVSVRLIFYHFQYVEVLFRNAAATQVSRHRLLIAVLPPRGPVDARIRATCHQRRQLFEAMAPVLRVAYSRAQVSPGLNDVLAEQRAMLRRQVAVTLGPEIASRGPDAPILLETLDLAAGWQNWDMLRFHAGRSASAAEQALVYSVTNLLR